MTQLRKHSVAIWASISMIDRKTVKEDICSFFWSPENANNAGEAWPTLNFAASCLLSPEGACIDLGGQPWAREIEKVRGSQERVENKRQREREGKRRQEAERKKTCSFVLGMN